VDVTKWNGAVEFTPISTQWFVYCTVNTPSVDVVDVVALEWCFTQSFNLCNYTPASMLFCHSIPTTVVTMGFKPGHKLYRVQPSLSGNIVPERTKSFLRMCDALEPNQSKQNNNPLVLSPDDVSMAIVLTHCCNLFSGEGLQVHPQLKKNWSEYWQISQVDPNQQSDINIEWDENTAKHSQVQIIKQIDNTKVFYIVDTSSFRKQEHAKKYIQCKVAKLLYTVGGKAELDAVFTPPTEKSAYEQLQKILSYTRTPDNK
jgi:hypothetical protein